MLVQSINALSSAVILFFIFKEYRKAEGSRKNLMALIAVSTITVITTSALEAAKTTSFIFNTILELLLVSIAKLFVPFILTALGKTNMLENKISFESVSSYLMMAVFNRDQFNAISSIQNAYEVLVNLAIKTFLWVSFINYTLSTLADPTGDDERVDGASRVVGSYSEELEADKPKHINNSVEEPAAGEAKGEPAAGEAKGEPAVAAQPEAGEDKAGPTVAAQLGAGERRAHADGSQSDGEVEKNTKNPDGNRRRAWSS